MRSFGVLFGVLAHVCAAGVSVLLVSEAATFAHEGHSDAGIAYRMITVTGKIKAIRIDGAKGKKSTSDFSLEDSSTGKVYSLHFTGGADRRLVHGANVTVKARDMGGGALMMGTNDGTGVLTANVVAATNGDQKTLVLMVDFADSSSQCSLQQVTDVVFTDPATYSMKALYNEMSWGVMTVSGEVHAAVKINAKSTDPCSTDAWAAAADSAASGMGISVSQFPHRIYVLPASGCDSLGWIGLGTILGNPSRSWIVGGYCGLHDVYNHEFGHNVGMHHSNADGNQEYHDVSDIMGYGGVGIRQVNGPHKVQMGWVGGAAYKQVGAGTYTIIPLETNPSGAASPSVLSIPKADTNDTYFLSYRRPIGADAGLSSGYANRLNIHTHLGGAIQTNLITTLGDGEVYTDLANGISFTAMSHTDAGLTLKIDAVCVSNAPSVTISPATQGGAAGATLSYSVNVQNRDSATCGPTAFNLSAALGGGFTSSFGAAALNVNAGQSGSTTVSVTSAAGTGSGTYPFTVTAADPLNAAHMASGDASYVIDGEAPTAPTGLTGSMRGKKVTLKWTPSTDNVGVTGYLVFRDGAQIATTGTNSYSVNAPSGQHTYFVKAKDAAGNISGASNSVTVGR